MFRVGYQVHAEVDHQDLIARFFRGDEAIQFLKELIQSLTDAGCSVSGKIERTLIEVTSLED